MRQTSKQGFTLVELLVVIAIIGTLVGLLLPAVQAAREAARSNTCRNNLTQLHKGLSQRESSLGDFPGYINNLGVKGTADQIRASWVVYTFPYLEQNTLWDIWSQVDGSSSLPVDFATFALPEIEILLCPSDPPVFPGQPNLSYAANAGFLQKSQDFDHADGENPANGVFFDASRASTGTPLVGPVDEYAAFSPISMTMAYIQQKGDGSTSTIMLAENIHQVFWAHKNSAGEYSFSSSVQDHSDEKWHFGVCWDDPDSADTAITNGNPRINADKTEDDYVEVSDICLAGDYRHAMPTALHPAGINLAFVGGSVRFVSDQISPIVYAQLMTSNRNKSDLFVGSGDTPESQLPAVSDSEF